MSVELIKADTFELDPNKRYLLVFNKHDITIHDMNELTRQLNKLGIKGVSVVIQGVSPVQVIEQ